MTKHMVLSRHALKLLTEFPDYADDARKYAWVNNTIVGSVIALTKKVPRQLAEAAVREALVALERRSRETG